MDSKHLEVPLMADPSQSEIPNALPLLPNHPQPGCEGQVFYFLQHLHRLVLVARESFQCEVMGKQKIPERNRDVQYATDLQTLDWLFDHLAMILMTPVEQSKNELRLLGHLNHKPTMLLILGLLYGTFRKNLATYTAGANAEHAIEAVLGWSKHAPKSLPIAEAVLHWETGTGGEFSASMLSFWASRVLNAITVSRGQGQFEWLALVADTLTEGISHRCDLAWYKLAVSNLSGKSRGSMSLVVREILMTEETIERPNELFNLLNGGYVIGRTARVTYKARRQLAMLQNRETVQPARAARMLMSKIRAALGHHDLDKKRKLYEAWIRSEWDVPSILFELKDIMKIVRDLDNKAPIDNLGENALQCLVVRHRNLKAVCARARSLARDVTALKNIKLPEDPGKINTAAEAVEMLEHILEMLNHVSCLISSQDSPRKWRKLQEKVHEKGVSILRSSVEQEGADKLSSQAKEFLGFSREALSRFIQDAKEYTLWSLKRPIQDPVHSRSGQAFEHTRMVGTNAEDVQRPRMLWDLVFNVTIESSHTSLPWVAVSHSWNQAYGSHFCFINERANIIPWAVRADINNVREAILKYNVTMGWMDKICLRQRGRDGHDSALRHLQWRTDLPLMDVAYRKAEAILVYLEGAGRPILQHRTFKSGASWLHRKWTAQETPQGIPLLLGNAASYCDREFFSMCEQTVQSWHQVKHKASAVNTRSCQKCCSIRTRFLAIRELWGLPPDAPEVDKLRCVWHLVRGRSAGCEADHVFSLLALLEVTRRPLYNPKYNIEQAVLLLKQHLSEEKSAILRDKKYEHWFDRMFSSIIDCPDWAINQLVVFRPRTMRITAQYRNDRATLLQLCGSVSRKSRVLQHLGQGVNLVDLVSKTNDKACFCQHTSQSLGVDGMHLLGPFFIWHGSNFCCVAMPAWEMDIEEEVRLALCDATHLMLSENTSSCVLLNRGSQSISESPVYDILPLCKILAFHTSSQLTLLDTELRAGSVVVRLKEEEG